MGEPMPPLDLLSSTEFWTSLFVALVGGGGVGAIIGAIAYLCLGMGTLLSLVIAVLTANVAALLAGLWTGSRK